MHDHLFAIAYSGTDMSGEWENLIQDVDIFAYPG